MRYIPISGLKAGMVCGKNLYDVSNQLMLTKGSVVRQTYIDRIKRLGYQGIYIDDEFSSDIIVRDVISNDLRMTAVDLIRDMCVYSCSNNRESSVVDKKVLQTREVVSSIIEQILGQDETLINLIDLKFHDDYTFFHSVNVSIMSLLMGLELEMDKEDLVNLGLAAMLHDIGKMFVKQDLLHRRGSLNVEEYKEVKRHVVRGYDYLRSIFDLPAAVYVPVLQHHEHYDGNGYPKGLKGEEIHPFARIICVTDVYDALTANRPYRKPMQTATALEYIIDNNGILFDDNLTGIFVKKVAPYPVGTYVRLNSGHAGIVFKNYSDDFRRPVVKLIIDRLGKRIKPIYVDLKHEKQLASLKIVGANEQNVFEMIQQCT